MKVTIDFETKSTVDLKKQGLAVYAAHPTTDILCMAYAFGDGEINLWLPGDPAPFNPADYEVHAHNANFEWNIWNQVCVQKYGWPELKLENLHCNMAMGKAMGLPASLEKLALALNLDVKKDMRGSRVMLQLCKPRKVHADESISWWTEEEFPEKYETLYEYCKKDVEVERATSKYLKPLSPKEREVWLLDQKINQRGIQIDIDSVLLAEKIIESEKKRLDVEMRKLTANEVASCSAVAQITEYVRSYGVEIQGVTKAEVISLLEDEATPERVKKVLVLRQEAARSSTAKLKAMKLRASNDGRVRNTLQYHAAHTGRWGGRGIQLQNLPRPNIPQSEIYRAFGLLKNTAAGEFIDTLIGPPTSILADCIRGFISAPEGQSLLVSDWSNIEGRVLAWLAGEAWKIEAFESFDNGTGPDLYLLSYSTSFHVAVEKVTKDMRQIGKVTELSMGYQGGVGAFQSMAINYGVKVTDDRADEIKTAWRNAHPKTVQFWYAVEDAAVNAVLNHKQNFKVGCLTFRTQDSFLMCRLPSGRVLHYPAPKIENVTTPWGGNKDAITYLTENSITRKWCREKTYGGKLVENITQAVARDILAESLLKIESKGHKTVGHVHDEIIIEGRGDIEEIESIMCEIPEWAIGLPLAAEGYKSKRYRK